MNTGSGQFGRPSMGSWVTYGIGSECDDLPRFVVLQSGPRGPRGGSVLWGSGMLPSSYQGVPLRNQGEPILNLTTPRARTPPLLARQADFAGLRFDSWFLLAAHVINSVARLANRRRTRCPHGDDRVAEGRRTSDVVHAASADRAVPGNGTVGDVQHISVKAIRACSACASIKRQRSAASPLQGDGSSVAGAEGFALPGIRT